MKHYFIYFLLFAFSLSIKAEVIFEIGKQDGEASEFALFPSDYYSFLSKFSGTKTFYVGYSSPETDWPYVLPGPLDSWAGGGYWAGYHPRHFPSIYFDIDEIIACGESTLNIHFAGINKDRDITLRVEINGHRFEQVLKGEDDSSLLKSENRKGTPVSISIPFSQAVLKEGMNQIQLGTVSGSWAVFDYISLESDSKVVLNQASSTLIKEVKAADFEYLNDKNQRVQPVLVDLVKYDVPKNLKFKIEGLEDTERFVEVGESIQEILMPALTSKENNKQTKIEIYDESKLIYAGSVTRSHQELHSYSDYVDLLMGTGNSRWMFKPSPTLPLSMVQISPDNQDETWKAGYEYTIENIMGFSHFCDWTMIGLLMQPTNGELKVNPGREQYPDEGYRSRIDKSTEDAKIGHYSVHMTDTDIKAELTATRRAALQRYTFPKGNDSRILIDMYTPNEYPHNLVDSKITKVSDTEIEGYATYYNAFTGYSLQQDYTLYFVLQFSKPFDSMGGWTNNEIEHVKGYIPEWNRNHEHNTEPKIVHDINSIEGKGDVGVFVNYNTNKGDEVLVRSGVSIVDMAGARNNLSVELEQPFGWDFEKVVANARSIWDEYLGRIDIDTDDYLQKKKFYTNFYRAIAAKATWSDADGRYRDEDEIIRQLDNADDCIVSGEYWNTFWDNQQLFNLITPEISEKWAKSAIELYKNTGWFNTDPAGIEHTGVMVAMHMISQIQGAWQSGIQTFDLELAFDGLKKMMTTPPQKYDGGGTVGVEHIIPYMEYGYIPSGKGTVSNTLEYAYDDWCLGQMAKVLGKEEDYKFFDKRSESWKNLFDTETGFIRPKDTEGNWISPFDPFRTPGFTEGNSFNYTWFVPQNPKQLVDAMGKDRFISRLDEAMEKSSAANFNAAGDNFSAFPINHGNQTSMEVSYLFNFADAPWLTQKWNRAIQEQYYGTTPYDAYPGDEDLGQMSSWFILSAIGLFQMDGGCAVEPQYELGSPRYRKVTLDLGEKYGRGKAFTIIAENASIENKYIQSSKLNGKVINSFRIPQKDILKGGILELVMGPEPNKDWGVE